MWSLILGRAGGNPAGELNLARFSIQMPRFLQGNSSQNGSNRETDCGGKNGSCAGAGSNGDVVKWEAPEFIRQNFPYYLSGYDDEGRPVWIVEVGKFPVRSLVEAGGDVLNDFSKYGAEAVRRIMHSIEAENGTDGDVHDAFFLLDFHGFDSYQITHPKALMLRMKMWREYKDALAKVIGRCVVINVSYMADMLIKMARPILGGVLERVEIYGTNPDKWKPALRRLLPPQSIPEWYGGSPEFKPIAVYG